MIKLIVLLLLCTSCSVATEISTSNMNSSPPSPLPFDPNLDNGAITSPNPGGIYPPFIDFSEKDTIPSGKTIDGKLIELINLLSSSGKLVLIIEDATESYLGSTMYLLTRDSDPTARQIRHTINSPILSQLDPLEKHVNYQLYKNKKTKVVESFNITRKTSEQALVSIGGISLTYILVNVNTAGNIFTFQSIHKGAPDMIIESTGTSTPFFQVTFPSFKVIKKIQIFTA